MRQSPEESRLAEFLGWLMVGILGIGILPSFTSLSTGLQGGYPEVFRFTGPINPLKLSLPLLALYIGWRRDQLPRSVLFYYSASFAVATLAAVIAAVPCGMPASHLREAAVMVT